MHHHLTFAVWQPPLPAAAALYNMVRMCEYGIDDEIKKQQENTDVEGTTSSALAAALVTLMAA